MEKLKDVQTIELFHVAFLDVLPKRVDRRRYILKGGANLRYFFGSLRYSEDLDLDLTDEPPWRLREKVDAILGAGPLPLLLRKAGLAIAEANPHKQTETTQRWLDRPDREPSPAYAGLATDARGAEQGGRAMSTMSSAPPEHSLG